MNKRKQTYQSTLFIILFTFYHVIGIAQNKSKTTDCKSLKTERKTLKNYGFYSSKNSKSRYLIDHYRTNKT